MSAQLKLKILTENINRCQLPEVLSIMNTYYPPIENPIRYHCKKSTKFDRNKLIKRIRINFHKLQTTTQNKILLHLLLLKQPQKLRNFESNVNNFNVTNIFHLFSLILSNYEFFLNNIETRIVQIKNRSDEFFKFKDICLKFRNQLGNEEKSDIFNYLNFDMKIKLSSDIMFNLKSLKKEFDQTKAKIIDLFYLFKLLMFQFKEQLNENSKIFKNFIINSTSFQNQLKEIFAKYLKLEKELVIISIPFTKLEIINDNSGYLIVEKKIQNEIERFKNKFLNYKNKEFIRTAIDQLLFSKLDINKKDVIFYTGDSRIITETGEIFISERKPTQIESEIIWKSIVKEHEKISDIIKKTLLEYFGYEKVIDINEKLFYDEIKPSSLLQTIECKLRNIHWFQSFKGEKFFFRKEVNKDSLWCNKQWVYIKNIIFQLKDQLQMKKVPRGYCNNKNNQGNLYEKEDKKILFKCLSKLKEMYQKKKENSQIFKNKNKNTDNNDQELTVSFTFKTQTFNEI
ncbi:hypothetical protein M0813_16452 [Anaeramoeba flamelloides]|uniref:Uncharacterized protein n=1 Tax=Anaeramoeba flamelloides TaxID=1746091 RepID=A0ABQ8YYT8_9EUKA|nr:hypothetical protein M0813_16452 [Anaeramoeba flamelloides]